MPLTSLPRLDGVRLRSYLLRLPLFTRICIILIVLFYILGLIPALDFTNWAMLTPSKVGLATSMSEAFSIVALRSSHISSLESTDHRHSSIVYRLNTYPFAHYGILHTGFNLFALTPLMERFEADHGTLLTVALFGGRESQPVRPTRYEYIAAF